MSSRLPRRSACTRDLPRREPTRNSISTWRAEYCSSSWRVSRSRTSPSALKVLTPNQVNLSDSARIKSGRSHQPSQTERANQELLRWRIFCLLLDMKGGHNDRKQNSAT